MTRASRAADPVALAIDTSTRTSCVALGSRAGPAATSRRPAGYRHGAHLLDQIGEVLLAAAVQLDDLDALVVGIGPGSFTGLRVGLATAKTIAHLRSLALVGVRSTDALRRAAADVAGAPPGAAVVLPAGAHDHCLARAGQDAILVPSGSLVAEVAGLVVVAVDVGPDLLGREASRLGESAVEGLPAAVLALGHERHARAAHDDVATLVPAYVALPRGIAAAAEGLAWSPDLR